MVLQRAPQRAVVWGFGDSKTLTTLAINGQTYTTISEAQIANDQGESIWSVTLDPVSDEGPFDIHVTQPSANGTQVTITLHDVLFGDVWICSGQSNMQLTIGMVYNGSLEIAQASNYPKIRVFTASMELSMTPIEELLNISLNWSLPSQQSLGGPEWTYMSAVCWLYGRMIHQALNGRPIGLVATSWGGTNIEDWVPPQGLEDCGSTSVAGPHNRTILYNAMIYPFTRMVIYGSIWYQGESNAGLPGNYSCLFAKMIYYWRQTWHERTNGSTDLEFPFGFVQVTDLFVFCLLYFHMIL